MCVLPRPLFLPPPAPLSLSFFFSIFAYHRVRFFFLPLFLSAGISARAPQRPRCRDGRHRRGYSPPPPRIGRWPVWCAHPAASKQPRRRWQQQRQTCYRAVGVTRCGRGTRRRAGRCGARAPATLPGGRGQPRPRGAAARRTRERAGEEPTREEAVAAGASLGVSDRPRRRYPPLAAASAAPTRFHRLFLSRGPTHRVPRPACPAGVFWARVSGVAAAGWRCVRGASSLFLCWRGARYERLSPARCRGWGMKAEAGGWNSHEPTTRAVPKGCPTGAAKCPPPVLPSRHQTVHVG